MNDDQRLPLKPDLSLEQKFSQRMFADQVQKMSHEQAQVVLIQSHEEMMVCKNIYREILKDAWGMPGGLKKMTGFRTRCFLPARSYI